MEFTFKSKIFSIKMGPNRLIVVLRNKIYVFSFPNNSKMIFSFDTCDNPKGLCDLSVNNEGILCFPSVKSGFVQVAVRIIRIVLFF
jgi:WD repeat-containing protein 45